MVKITRNALHMISENYSLNNISKLTGFRKSMLYYHYKKMKGKKYKEIDINFKSDTDLGEFLGVFAGDGHFHKSKIGHYTIRITIGYYESNYASYLVNQFTMWFNKKPKVYYGKYKNHLSMIIIHYDSKKLYNLLKEYLMWEGTKKTYTVRLKKFNIYNNKFNLGFVKGLIDTDGNYYAPKRSLNFSTTSKLMMLQVFEIIKYNLKVNPKISIYKKKNRADLYNIHLYGINTYNLNRLIKFGNPSKRCKFNAPA